MHIPQEYRSILLEITEYESMVIECCIKSCGLILIHPDQVLPTLKHTVEESNSDWKRRKKEFGPFI